MSLVSTANLAALGGYKDQQEALKRYVCLAPVDVDIVYAEAMWSYCIRHAHLARGYSVARCRRLSVDLIVVAFPKHLVLTC